MSKTDSEKIVDNIHIYGLNEVTREIYLHSVPDSSEEPGIEYRMAINFIKNLHYLDSLSDKNILVHMHCIGGEWSDGMAMYDAIRNCRSPVTIIAYAQASSMSGVLLQGADNRIIMPNCGMMIHYGSIGICDNSLAASSLIKVNDQLCVEMLKIFAWRASHSEFFVEKPIRQIEKYLDNIIKDKSDWYLTAAEAVKLGFADGVYGTKGNDASKIRLNYKIDMSDIGVG